MVGGRTIAKTFKECIQVDSLCSTFTEMLSREGFNIYRINRTDELTEVQLLNNAPLAMGEVEAIDIAFHTLEEGYKLELKVAVHGRDMVRVLPEGIEIVENAISDLTRGSGMGRYTIGVLGIGALNAFKVQKRLLQHLENLARTPLGHT